MSSKTSYFSIIFFFALIVFYIIGFMDSNFGSVSFHVKFAGGNQNIIQKKREKLLPYPQRRAEHYLV